MQLHTAFDTLKVELPDNGFSERIVRMLPERSPVLPQIIVGFCSLVGVALAFLLVGAAELTERMVALTGLLNVQMLALTEALSRMEPLAPTTTALCVGGAAIAGLIGVALGRWGYEI